MKEIYEVPLANERTPLRRPDYSSSDDDDVDYFDHGSLAFADLKPDDDELQRADALSTRLLEIEDDDSEAEERILRKSLNLLPKGPMALSSRPLTALGPRRRSGVFRERMDELFEDIDRDAKNRVCAMVGMFVGALFVVFACFYVGVVFVGPPNLPVGPYRLLERQEGDGFFTYYQFYEGPDSVGSNGFNEYVSMQRATELGIVNVTYEKDELDVFGTSRRRRLVQHDEPFVYMSSMPTEKGPRESIRLEGKRRFDRGLFIVDLRHMPAGCGVWPAFWLTDEAYVGDRGWLLYRSNLIDP